MALLPVLLMIVVIEGTSARAAVKAPAAKLDARDFVERKAPLDSNSLRKTRALLPALFAVWQPKQQGKGHNL